MSNTCTASTMLYTHMVTVSTYMISIAGNEAQLFLALAATVTLVLLVTVITTYLLYIPTVIKYYKTCMFP